MNFMCRVIIVPVISSPPMAFTEPLLLLAILGLTLANRVKAADDPLTPWRSGVQVRPVSPGAEYHTIHTYFNTCPESPDGRYVLFFASTARDGQVGEVRVRNRETGQEKVLARNLHVEDAHRVAVQQWVSRGRRVVFNSETKGVWGVTVVDVDSGEAREMAPGRLCGFCQPNADLVPLYGPHWAPGAHRDFEMLNVETGEIRTLVTVDEVKAAYPDWMAKTFEDKPPSIFFPILSPDLTRAFFKMATPAGGDARSKSASQREGLICVDLAAKRFLFTHPRWGHPSWHPDSRTIVNAGFHLFDSNTGEYRTVPGLPRLRGDHPTASPDGKLLVSDTTMDVLGGNVKDWSVILADARGTNHLVLQTFDNSRGAASWRRSHPHPVFSADGRRIYFNASDGPWTRLMVAELPLTSP